jgi:predicted transcriptional regulator of viral defense system
MKGVHEVTSLSGTLRAGPPRDVEIRELAERQHGVVSLVQLQSVGLTASGVRSRVAAGRLARVHRGVYAFGHGRLTRHGRWMAATLAYGPGAKLSYRSAAGLHGIRPDNRPNTDVTLPSPSARSRPGIDVHTSATLQPADITTVDEIPCTSPARTLLDLTEVLDRRGIERVVDQAELLRIFDLRAVEEVLSRAAGRRRASILRDVLARYKGPTITRRELEERFLALCRSTSLPSPAVNAWIALDDGTAYQADFLWREQRLIVETDGWDAHGTRQAFEHDRRRDRSLCLAGYTVVRFTWRDVLEEPDEVAATVARLLARSGWEPVALLR